MAGKANTFSAAVKIAGCLCFEAIILQIAGINTDHLQSMTFTEKRHWGLWNYCYETSVDTKCYSLFNSDVYVLKIISVPSLWMLFQAANVVGLMLLGIVLLLIVTQLCCLQYNSRSIVAAVTLSTIAGLLMLSGCIVYAVIYAVIKSAGHIDNGQLEYSFGLLVAAGVMAIICAIILNFARRSFLNDQTRPASDSIGPHHARNHGTPSPDVISYQQPHRELQHSAYDNRQAYHVPEQKSLPQ